MISPEIYIKRALKAKYVDRIESIQTLWSGYGEIVRYRVHESGVIGEPDPHYVILKSIRLDKVNEHPRGWQSHHAHERKLRSYDMEANWYENWSSRCSKSERVAQCYGVWRSDDAIYILMEDLDASHYSVRKVKLAVHECLAVLDWLANFHARFLGIENRTDSFDLWQRGTYWHLSTRPDEWHAMTDSLLKEHANRIDSAMEGATYKTLLHGDAKVANFCFSADLNQVAAVDFQYVGVGIGVQDVAYFLGSCLSEENLSENLSFLLEHYFGELSRCLVARGESPDSAEKVVMEWDALFVVAWADFHRFILGWSPEHAKNTAFSRNMATKGVEFVLRRDG
ncbi:phosphotransferase [Marinomonas balearica]|uniref:Ecdysteroid kinase n=1 Tax=Marinomonas balearica TaxID=491947 RepID=A0A4R6MLM4_9GAMM|nr:oxidoreductase family protein [Marinomonas balearica]TDP01220.1 ecdysteroid kinase [Marinomonas balearica]